MRSPRFVISKSLRLVIPNAVRNLLLVLLLSCGVFAQADSYDDIVMVATSAVTTPFLTPVTGTVGPVIPPVVGSGSGTCNPIGSNCAWAIPNINQASHWLEVCESASVTALQIEIEASSDTVNWVAISEVGTQTGGGCFQLEAGIYKKFIRVNLIQLTGVNANITAWYSATKTAIPGGGTVKGGKSSQPVTFYPDTTFSNTNLKSTPAALSTSPASIGEIDAGNPNASIVYLVITGTTSSTTAVYLIPASSARAITDNRGIQLTANSTVACATAASGVGDPGTGCVVTIHYKPFANINGQVGSNGQTTKSNFYIPN